MTGVINDWGIMIGASCVLERTGRYVWGLSRELSGVQDCASGRDGNIKWEALRSSRLNFLASTIVSGG
jgi:hypothetical protein